MTHVSTSHLSNSNTPSSEDVEQAGHYRAPLAIDLAERGWLPDSLLRWGMRRICSERLNEEHANDLEARDARFKNYLADWSSGPLAIATEDANEQHYELPPAFFEATLGKHLKYSSAYWPDGINNLDAAETAMLALTCNRAELGDGMNILELGCGWGSLSLWMARHYPNARITAVSNSAPQRGWIMEKATNEGLNNLDVITADINDFSTQQQFDRVISVEMFEHLRNHALLFKRIRGWLRDDGKLFTHVFCHRELAYPYETQGDNDWMARYFFTGGIMPSYNLFLHYQQDLQLDNRWWLSGTHYEKTSNAWLARLDASRDDMLALFEQHYPSSEAARWVQRWRMFYMAVAELFGYDRGQQWGVGHYLFRPQ